MITLKISHRVEFKRAWNSRVKLENRIDDDGILSANYILNDAFVELRLHVDRLTRNKGNAYLAWLREIGDLDMNDAEKTVKKVIETHGITIDLASCITINGKEGSLHVPIDWLDFV